MRNGPRWFPSLLLAAALAVPMLATNCAPHRTEYRVYDPYYSDYHVWNDNEGVYYRQWVHETHRHYRDFRKLRPEEQKEYWTWRHAHPDRDRH